MNETELIKYLKDKNSRMAFLIGQFYSFVCEWNMIFDDKNLFEMADRARLSKAQEVLFAQIKDIFYGDDKKDN